MDPVLGICIEMGHDGPLAPGVVPSKCHADGPTLLKELNPKFVASASLGQVGRLGARGPQMACCFACPGDLDNLLE